jgi:hypothetical protein
MEVISLGKVFFNTNYNHPEDLIGNLFQRCLKSALDRISYDEQSTKRESFLSCFC